MSAARLVRSMTAWVRLRPYSTSTVVERSKERYRRAGLSTVASLATQGATTLATLMSVPLALGYLGNERYGLWMSVNSLVAVVAAADLGIGNGLLNAIAAAHGKEDRRLAARYVSSAFFLLSGVAAALAALAAILAPLVPWGQLFNVSSPSAASEAEPAVLILLGCSFVSLPFGVAARIHMGYQEGFINSFWQALGTLLGLFGLVAAILLRMSMPWVILGLAAGPVLGSVSNLIVLGSGRRWLLPTWNAVRSDAVVTLLKTGLMFAVLQAVVAGAYVSDNLIVARIFGPNAVVEYSVHAQLFGLAPLVAAIAVTPLWPAYGEALARGDADWVRHALVRSVVATFAFVSAVSILLVFVGPALIRLWIGSSVTPSLGLMVALATWGVLSSVGSAIAMFMNGAGLLRMQVVIACVMGVAAVLSKIASGLLFGLPGVPWGTSVAYLLFALIPLGLLLPRAVARIGNRP